MLLVQRIAYVTHQMQVCVVLVEQLRMSKNSVTIGFSLVCVCHSHPRMLSVWNPSILSIASTKFLNSNQKSLQSKPVRNLLQRY